MANSAFTPAVLTVSGSSSTSSGEKNYVTATDGNASGLWASSTSPTVTISTSTSTIPDNITKASSLAIAWVSGTTGYARYRFTLDQADYGKKFKIQWDQVYGTAGHWTLQVWSNTASDYTGTSTQLTVQTSAVPGITGTFTTSVDMPGSTAPYIEIRIVASSTSATTIYLNSILMGPGTITQGAAISEWQSYTDTVQGGGTATFSYQNRQYRRVGSSVEINYEFSVTGAGSGSSYVMIPLPAGLSINQTVAPNSALVGVLSRYVNVGTTQTMLHARTILATSTTAIGLGTATGGAFVGSNLAVSDLYQVRVMVPCAEFSGSGTVSLGAGAQVEYASNSSSTNLDDTSSFVYGPDGSTGIFNTTALTSARAKRIRFQYPVQVDDIITIEVKRATGPWIDISNSAYINGLGPLTYQNGVTYGLGFNISGVSSTDIDVVFGQYAYASSTYGAAGVDWNAAGFANYKWRVRKAKASSPVGFGIATTDSSGLMKNRTDNADIAAASLTWSTATGTITVDAGDILLFKWRKLDDLIFLTFKVGGITLSSSTNSVSVALPSTIPVSSAEIYATCIIFNNSGSIATIGQVSIASGGRTVSFNIPGSSFAATSNSTYLYGQFYYPIV